MARFRRVPDRVRNRMPARVDVPYSHRFSIRGLKTAAYRERSTWKQVSTAHAHALFPRFGQAFFFARLEKSFRMLHEGKSLKGTFISYMVPAVAAQWVFALYTMIDGIFVAKGISEVALSSVNISMPFITFLFSLSLMFAMGSSTIIAIHFGKKDYAAANRLYTQNIVTMAVFAIVMTILVSLNLERFARFLGATTETLPYVMDYVGTASYFNCFFVVSYLFEILTITDGHPKLATLFVTCGAILHLILNVVFIYWLKWGVFGAGLSTGLSQLFQAILYLSHFLSKRSMLKFVAFRFQGRELWRTIKLGLPSGITEMSAGVVIFLINHAIIRYFGTDALVSFSVISYVNTIIVMSMMGVVQGLQPLVSYFYGRNDWKKCETLLKYGLVAATAIPLVMIVPAWIGADVVVGFFVSPEMRTLFEDSVSIFRTYSVAFLLLGYNVVLGGYFTAIEREKSSAAISLGRGLVFIYLSIELLTSLAGGSGIWWVGTASEGMCLGLSAFLFFLYRRDLAKTHKDIVLAPV
ncbi:MAG: MATE family efflux transporter [Planctomycetes bacterium]|nr:MATE family efflux transporter [Planctomycetota bacterium]